MPGAPKTVDGEVRRTAAEYGDHPFLRFGPERLTFSELDERTRRVAAGATGLGLRPGDHVALFMANRMEFVLGWLGLARIGITVIPINAGLVGDGLVHVLRQSQSRGVVVEPELLPTLEQALETTGRLGPVVVCADDGGAHQPWSALEGDSTAMPDVDVGPLDPMMMMFTSGTTGLPKGLLLPQRRIMDGRYVWQEAGIRPDDRPYTCLPLFHGNAALISLSGSLSLGLELTLGRRFSASRFWSEIREADATTFNALGAMLSILWKTDPDPSDRDNPVRFVLSAACPKEIWRGFEERFDLELVEFYGTMEGGMTMAGTGAPIGSMGKPVFGFEMRVVRPDGSDCDADEVGDLISRPPGGQAKVEYFDNPEASRSKVQDGWLQTGDRVYRDAEGWLFFVDRADHVIRRRGENISSTDIEAVANAHPAVLESAAYALPADLGEDDVALAVVAAEGVAVDPADLSAYCAERLAAYQHPRYIRVVDQLPKTETHRVQKQVLRSDGLVEGIWDRERVTT